MSTPLCEMESSLSMHDASQLEKSTSTDGLNYQNYPSYSIMPESIQNLSNCDTNEDYLNNPVTLLRDLKLKNVNRLNLAHININSLRNKFESLKEIINENIDILVVSETKLDNSYPDAQFHLPGFNSFRYDRDSLGGGIIAFIREDIPSKELKSSAQGNIEGYFIELNLRRKKWVLFVGYNPHKNYISNFLKIVGHSLNKHLSSYDNLILMGDFNSEMSENEMKEFCEIYHLKNLIKEPTCYKNP